MRLPSKGMGFTSGFRRGSAMNFPHALVPYVARWPDDPGENDRLIILALDGHGKRRDLAFRHIISPAFDEFQRTVLLEDHSGRFGVLLVDFTIGSRNGRNKSIDIGHDAFLRRSIADHPYGADCAGTSGTQSVRGAR